MNSMPYEFRINIEPRADWKRPCFDQLKQHILECQQNSSRSKLGRLGWLKKCPLTIALVLSDVIPNANTFIAVQQNSTQ